VSLHAFQSRLIFFPERLPGPPPLPRIPGRVVEHVSFPAADGTALRGVWLGPEPGAARAKGAPARPVVLYSHGNAGHLGYRLDRLAALAALDVDVLLYDYRGFGESQGSPSVDGVVDDAAGALAWIEARGVPAGRIVLYGESIGSGVSTALARRRDLRVGGLVLESPFRSLRAMAGRVIPFLGPLLLSRDLPNDEVVREWRGPLLVIHSRADEVVPFDQGRAVHEACPSARKAFLELDGFGHNDPVWLDSRYLEAWRRFLAQAFPP